MKKLLSIILALIICLSITACGGSDDRYDIVYDDDGFMGYSDSFWDWYAENN